MAIEWYQTFKLAGFLILNSAIAFFSQNAIAQNIVPDNTLGAENSKVTPNIEINGVESDRLEGGAQRGANLFHSFSEFNLEGRRGAYFANPPGIENILGRVTGANPSEILGTLGVQGDANLFLINPNGIIFGENARLDVGGSFLGSTADSILFPNGIEFDATNTQAKPILTINAPIGLGLPSNPGEIVNRSRIQNSAGDIVGLEVPSGKNLTLVGGNINFEGGQATARGGNIELGGLSVAGQVSIEENGSLNFPEDVARADITLSNDAVVGITGTGGGNIAINTHDLKLEAGDFGSSTIYAITSANSTGSKAQARDITINATGEININNSIIDNQVELEAVGDGGDITIITGSISLSNGGQINASTSGRGNAGSVEITANNVAIDESLQGDPNPSGVFSQVGSEAEGDGGNVTITTDTLSLNNGATVSASTSGQGNGGDVNISAETLSLTNKGQVSASTFGRGNAGSVEITASNQVTIDDQSSQGNPGGVFSQVGSEAEGDGGNVTITTDTLSLNNGATVSASTSGQGNGGDVNISAETLSLTNKGQVSASTFGRGNAGSVEITASNQVTIDDQSSQGNPGGVFSQVGSEAEGDGGNVTITTDALALKNGATISTITLGQGNGGDVNISAAQLTLKNQGELLVSGRGNFNPGNLEIDADNITLDNQSIIEANTESGSQGNITLNTENLLTLRRESEISTNATGTANGGNITINADDGFIVAVPEENSDITANAAQDRGGRVFIDATSLYGIEPRQQLTPQSDITASSQLGSEFNGIVEINTPDVDRDRHLVQLPTQPTETEIVQACAPSDTEEQSEFTIEGRGGLPPSPEDTIDGNETAVDWVTRQPQNPNSPEISPNSDSSEPIIEAQGWIVDDNNEIALIAHNPNNAWQNSPQCQKKAEGQNQRQSHSLLSNNSNQNILIASTQAKSLTTKVPERISVERFEVEGNRVFDSQELASVLAPFTDKPLSFAELLQARTAITEYYTKRGYITSGAYIPLQKLQDKVVTVRVIEGYLEEIKITGDRRLNSDYLSSRIETATDDSLQQEKLLSALQLLQQDPLIASLSAELEAGTRPGASVLEVEVNEADSFKTPILLDNRRTPSIGSFRRQFAINESNLLGFGDNLFLVYSNTEGSDAFDGSYAFPFNASNGTITVRGGVSGSEVIEEPFDQLNILGNSHYYELSLRQPLVQTPTQEFALGITASRRNSNISSLLEEFNVPPSELSPGANESGQTQVSALRFFQEWTRRSSNEVIAARSQFNLGLSAFDATVNDDAPDSRFISWQGQAQWTRQLARDTLFLLRGGIQLATTSLLPSEQFGLGGLETLRGYRQDLLLTDNSAFATAEIRLPLFRIRATESVFQLAPFFDVGTAWNNGGRSRDVAGSNTLASIGLGLRLSLFNSFTARFDYGIPLVAVDTESNTWQENGFYFSVEHSPF